MNVFALKSTVLVVSEDQWQVGDGLAVLKNIFKFLLSFMISLCS